MDVMNNVIISITMKTNTSSTPKTEGKEQRNKATICATVSPWLKTRLERMVDGKEFSSVSDIVSLACHEFIIRHFPDQDELPDSEKKK
jgi:hypothetical protein